MKGCGKLSAALLVMGAAFLPVLSVRGQEADFGLGIRGSAQESAALTPFTGLPQPPAVQERRSEDVHAGTEGVALPAVHVGSGPVTLAILGDLEPANDVTRRFTRTAVYELNQLRPELVLTVGNLVPGMSRDGNEYVRQIMNLRRQDGLGGLKMPWYPCVGQDEVVSGTRLPGKIQDRDEEGAGGDRRFEALYQDYLGPLYYSLDAGAVHVIVLDSEEGVGGGNAISERQLRWLKGDLNQAFDRGTARARWIVVLLHRPLWRLEAEKSEPGNWDRVHEMLRDFNRRPIVSVEGMGGAGGPGGGAEAWAPRVIAVIAGSRRAYSQEPTRDGIRYYVLGPTAALPRAGEDATEAVRSLMLLKFQAPGASTGEAGAAGMHAALVRLGEGGMHPLEIGALEPVPTIAGDDLVEAREREVIDAIAGCSNSLIGVDGMIDNKGNPLGETEHPAKVSVHFSNPLGDALDFRLRLAGAQFVEGPRRETANALIEGLDLPWELDLPHTIRHLTPGGKDAYDFSIKRPEGYTSASTAPPQVEFVTHWNDPRGRTHEFILKRKITVVPQVQVAVSRQPLHWEEDQAWQDAAPAAGGEAFVWDIRGDEPAKVNPNFDLLADSDRLYLRVHVHDGTPAYWPAMKLDESWGGIASDAVSMCWARHQPAGADTIERVWALPFGPKGPELWTNRGTGTKQTPLLKLDSKWGIEARLQKDAAGYTLALALPRKLLFTDAAGVEGTRQIVGKAVLNVSVHDNDGAARTWVRSWAREEAGPAAWGSIELVEPSLRGTTGK